LNPKPTHFLPKKKACTYQHVLIMEGGEMEADVTMQQDDESIWIESDQSIKDKSKHDYK
jgi:hypothetical protein